MADLGDSEGSIGQAYVAMSRTRQLSDLAFVRWPPMKRFDFAKKLERRLYEMTKLRRKHAVQSASVLVNKLSEVDIQSLKL